MKIKILFIVLLCTQFFFGQEKGYQGKIIDKKTGEPIFGVSILLNNTEVTYSNELGEFQFFVKNVKKFDTIKFHHMSYEKYEKPLLKFRKKVIKLKNNFNLLDEIVISSKVIPEGEIIKKAKEKYEKSYRKEGFWSYGNYQQLLSYNGLSSGYFEVTGNINHRGTIDESVWRSMVIVPDEVRRTKEDVLIREVLGDRYKKTNYEYLYGGGLFAYSTLGYYRFFEIFHPLNKKGKSRFRYVLNGKEEIDGKDAYVISFQQKRRKIKMSTRYSLKAQGKIWIDKSNYSMIRVDVSYDYENMSSNNFTTWYKEVKGETYPYKVSMNSYLYVNKLNKEKALHLESELKLSKIDPTIRKSEHGVPYSFLIKHRSFSEIPYRSSFWGNYPIKNLKFKKGVLELTGKEKIDTVFFIGSKEKVTIPRSKSDTEKIEKFYSNLIERVKKDLKRNELHKK
ncbi:MAG: carboxypeptidase-like regulatory domain-containing protein [Flavobacteriaceae bacterium]